MLADGHVSSEMVIHWLRDNPIKKDEMIELPEHIIDSVNAENKTVNYTIGKGFIDRAYRTGNLY